MKANLNAAGVQEILYEGINPGEKDYSAIIGKLKAVGAEVLYYGGYPTEGGLIVRQAADQGAKFQMVTTSSFVTPEFWLIAGPAGEGTLFPAPRNPMGLDTAKHVVDEFRATGYEPTGFTLFSYATVQALAEGVRRAARWMARLCACAAHGRCRGYGVRPGNLRRKRRCRRHDLRDERLARWALRETALRVARGSVRDTQPSEGHQLSKTADLLALLVARRPDGRVVAFGVERKRGWSANGIPPKAAQQNRHRCPEGLILGAMKRTIDDLPLVRVATLVAFGEIERDAKTARVRFGDDGIEYQVGVRLRRFRNGGFWAMLVCPRCGGAPSGFA